MDARIDQGAVSAEILFTLSNQSGVIGFERGPVAAAPAHSVLPPNSACPDTGTRFKATCVSGFHHGPTTVAPAHNIPPPNSARPDVGARFEATCTLGVSMASDTASLVGSLTASSATDARDHFTGLSLASMWEVVHRCSSALLRLHDP